MVKIKSCSVAPAVSGSLFALGATGATSALITVISITWNVVSIVAKIVIILLAVGIVGIASISLTVSLFQEYILCRFNIGYLGADSNYISGYDLNQYEIKDRVEALARDPAHATTTRKLKPLTTQKR